MKHPAARTGSRRWGWAAWLLSLAVLLVCAAASTAVFGVLSLYSGGGSAIVIWAYGAIFASVALIVVLPALLVSARLGSRVQRTVTGLRERLRETGPGRATSVTQRTTPSAFRDLALEVAEVADRYESRHLADCEQVARTEEASREVMNLSEAAEAASRAKSQFLANMSHELRTPLNAINGFSELLSMQRGGDLSSSQQRYVNHILTSGRHLLSLINDILDLSKVEAGKMDLHVEEIEFAEVCEGALGIVRDFAIAKSIAIDTSLPSGSVGLGADKKKVRQILLNLLSNAVKFTPPRGRIGIRARMFNDDEVDNELVPTLEVAVWDTGPGIAPDHRGKIFAEFQQVDASYTREQEGTGLGLALSRKLVELHGGRIWFETEVGQGTTFYFTIPHQQEKSPESPRVETPRPQWDPEDEIKKQLPTVLVVERNRTRVEHLEDLLTREEFQTVVADSPQVVVRKARELRPVAIIVNILMTRKGGWRILKELQKDPVTSVIPVMFVADLDEEHIEFSLGAVAYLEKTVESSVLLDYVRRLRDTAGDRGGSGRAFDALMIDDDPLVAERVGALLRAEGIRLTNATTGRDGVLAAQKQQPAMIFLDLILPDLDGFEVATRLRSHPATKGIPLLIFTAGDLRTENLVRLGSTVFGVAQQGVLTQRDFLRDLEMMRRLNERSRLIEAEPSTEETDPGRSLALAETRP